MRATHRRRTASKSASSAQSIAAYRGTLPQWQHEGNRGALANQVESVALLAAPTRPAAAARLLAAARAIRDVADAPMLAFERTEVDAALVVLRTRLGEPALQTAEREGHQLDRGAVIREALDLLDELEGELSPVDPPG